MFAPSVLDIAAAARPPWLECASSMMMAKRLPRCSEPMASEMNGNFCTVVMIIFLPAAIRRRRSVADFGARQRGANLRELAYRVVDLAVEYAAVGNHDDGAKFGFAAALQLHKAMRQPSDGVGFAAAGGVLHKVALPCAVRLRIGEKLSHSV